MMELFCIPHNNVLYNNLGDKLPQYGKHTSNLGFMGILKMKFKASSRYPTHTRRSTTYV